jgi:hypothetical protein
MLPKEFDDVFRHQGLKDLILVGFGDDMWGIKTFHPMMHAIFLEFEGAILKLADPHQHVKIQITIADKVDYSTTFEIDPDDEFVVFPALNLFTRYEVTAAPVEQLILFYDEYCDLNIPEYRAIGIKLANHAGYLFFDPLNWTGIAIGSTEKEKEFISNMEDKVGKTGFGKLITKTYDYHSEK